MHKVIKTIIALILLAHAAFGGEPVKKEKPAIAKGTNNFPANYSYAGWRGGIGVAFGQPAVNIPDVTELGLNIVWGGEDPRRAAMLDIAVFHYWNSVVEISLKDPDGRYDFSQMDNKDLASKLAFDKFSELQYGIPGLSKYANVRHSPGGAYGDVYGEMDLSSNNPLVKAVVSSRLESLTGRQKLGGIALDNAGKVPGLFLEYLQNTLHPEGFGIATNGGSEQLYRYIDFIGKEGFLFSQQTMNNMQSKGFKGILGEFVTRQLSSGELEGYLKAKLFNGIVYFGYTDGRDRAAATNYSFFYCRPDIYDHQRWILRKILPLSKAMSCASPQDNPCARILSNKETGLASQANDRHKAQVDTTGRVIEPGLTESDKDDIFGGTLSLDGSIKRYGNDIKKGIYLYVNSNRSEVIECNADTLGIKAGRFVFDEFSETTLKSKKKGNVVRFNTPSGPSLIQLGDTKTVVGNILLRVSESFKSQLLQRQMDEKLGLGYTQKSVTVPPTLSKTDFDKPRKPWEPFCQGYLIDLKTKKSGKGSLRTDGNTYSVYGGQWLYHNRQGAAQFVMLNQSEPVPLTLTAFSKSENVKKSELKAITETNRRDHFGERLGYYYAMHLYLDYQDGSWPDVHTFAFSPGTHDWEEGKITVVPKKAVKTAMVLVELHQPQGTAWFDDFSLVEKTDPERNLLANADFGDSDVLLDKTKAPEYDKKVTLLMSNVNEVQKQISIEKLKKLDKDILSLKDWLSAQGIAKMYGREMRDLIDAQHKLDLCCRLLKK